MTQDEKNIIVNACWASPYEGTRKLVLIRLAYFLRRAGDYADPSQETLAKYCSCKSRLIRWHIAALAADGVVQVKLVKTTGVGGFRNQYRIPLDAVKHWIPTDEVTADLTPSPDLPEAGGHLSPHPPVTDNLTPRSSVTSLPGYPLPKKVLSRSYHAASTEQNRTDQSGSAQLGSELAVAFKPLEAKATPKAKAAPTPKSTPAPTTLNRKSAPPSAAAVELVTEWHDWWRAADVGKYPPARAEDFDFLLQRHSSQKINDLMLWLVQTSEWWQQKMVNSGSFRKHFYTMFNQYVNWHNKTYADVPKVRQITARYKDEPAPIVPGGYESEEAFEATCLSSYEDVAVEDEGDTFNVEDVSDEAVQSVETRVDASPRVPSPEVKAETPAEIPFTDGHRFGKNTCLDCDLNYFAYSKKRVVCPKSIQVPAPTMTESQMRKAAEMREWCKEKERERLERAGVVAGKQAAAASVMEEVNDL